MTVTFMRIGKSANRGVGESVFARATARALKRGRQAAQVRLPNYPISRSMHVSRERLDVGELCLRARYGARIEARPVGRASEITKLPDFPIPRSMHVSRERLD